VVFARPLLAVASPGVSVVEGVIFAQRKREGLAVVAAQGQHGIPGVAVAADAC